MPPLAPPLPIPVNLIEWRVSSVSRSESATRCCARVAGDLAERQAGRVGRRQLLRIGFEVRVIDELVHRRLLRAEHQGVYAVGHRSETQDGRRMAALLAVDEMGALAGSAACEVWGVIDEDPERDLRLVVADGVHHERPGLHVVRSKLIVPQDVTTHRRLVLTRPAKAVLELAAEAPGLAIGAADKAILRRRCSPAALRNVIDRHRRVRGRRLLLGFLADRLSLAPRLRSELERRLAELLLQSDLPEPLFNAVVPVEGDHLEVDVCWPAHRLIVEADGRRYHEGLVAEFEDARRDALLAAAGWRVIRIAWWDVAREPGRLLHRLRRELGRR